MGNVATVIKKLNKIVMAEFKLYAKVAKGNKKNVETHTIWQDMEIPAIIIKLLISLSFIRWLFHQTVLMSFLYFSLFVFNF